MIGWRPLVVQGISHWSCIIISFDPVWEVVDLVDIYDHHGVYVVSLVFVKC